MKGNNMKKYITNIVIGVFLVLLISTCDVVGLGPLLNLKGPIVLITEPVIEDPEQTNLPVTSAFMMKGTIESIGTVNLMEITLHYNDLVSKQTSLLGREWKYEKGKWYYKAEGNIPWAEYNDSHYTVLDIDGDPLPVEAPSWKKNESENMVYWALPIVFDKLFTGTGDYFITVKAWDTAKNHDADSSVRLKVYYNNNEPQLSIELPADPILKPGDIREDTAYPKINEDLKEYIYEPVLRPMVTTMYINHWITEKPFSFKYRISGDPIPPAPFNMVLEFTNEHNLVTGDGKKVYKKFEYTNLGIVGEFPITLNMAELDILPSDPDYPKPDKPTYMQIVAKITDASGNSQYKSHGFIAYLPDAEKPWVDPRFAHPTNPENGFIMTGTTNIGNPGIAYSKNGLQSLSWKLYKLVENSNPPVVVSSGKGSLSDPWTSETSVDGNTTFTGPIDELYSAEWHFTADNDSTTGYGTGGYKIDIMPKDINNMVGTYSYYFMIENNTTPTRHSGPISNMPFGNASGNIEISGTIQVLDPYPVHRVTVVWIKPNIDQEASAESTLRYTDRLYENWDGVTAGSYKDYPDSRVWELNSSSITMSADPLLSDGQRVWNFTKTINLFNPTEGLNIGPSGNRLEGQQFLVRFATYRVGTSGSYRSSVVAFTSSGETKGPELKITKMTLNNTVIPLPITPAGTLLPVIRANDTVQFEGTWKDDSLDVWGAAGGIAENTLRTYYRNFNVRWQGTDKNELLPINANSFWVERENKTGPNETIITWRTQPYTFTSLNLDSSVDIIASITDLGGITGSGSTTINIETNNPTLTGFSCSLPDGAYSGASGEGTIGPWTAWIYPNTTSNKNQFDINVHFNKQVMFNYDAAGNPVDISSQDAPYLELNNGGRAFYRDGNGTNQFRFTYYVDGKASDSDGHSSWNNFGGNTETDGTIARLNVTGIGSLNPNYTVDKWVSNEAKSPLIIPSAIWNPATPTSFAGTKNIEIDKKQPRLLSITTSANSSVPHGKGSTIFITATFNEPINIVNSTSLKLQIQNGNNPLSPAATADYSYHGENSITFMYTVVEGHNTTGTNRLNVGQLEFGTGRISDKAGNIYDEYVRPTTVTLNSQQIDTDPPLAPTISGLENNKTYYGNVTFTITGEAGASLQYSTNSGSSWSTTTGSVTLTDNGTYTIVAQQFDNATTPNRSPHSTSYTITIDKGDLLERITSSTPDGLYGYYEQGSDTTRQNINVTLVFRKPVYVPSGSTDITATFNLLNGGTTTRNITANITPATTDNKEWQFNFPIENNDNVTGPNYLNLTALNLGSVVFRDKNGTGADSTDVTEQIILDNVTLENRLNRQKQIEIMTGRPLHLNNNQGTATTNGITFTTTGTGANLRATGITIRFNRTLFRGSTDQPIKIIQELGSGTSLYRIPTVLTVDEWNVLFLGRDDIPNITEAEWKTVGETLYKQSSNGASADFVSDTSVKYVLDYRVNSNLRTGATPDADQNLNTVLGVTGLPTAANLRTYFREAEALKFYTNDKEITLPGTNVVINLDANNNGKPLPVRGVSYQLTFPDGFVQDTLGATNNGSMEGAGTFGTINLSYSGVEAPVIRIDKGTDIPSMSGGTGNNNQVQQPLTAGVKIDSRTPAATISHRRVQTDDNVATIITRENRIGNNNENSVSHTNVNNPLRGLPNVGTMTDNAQGQTSFVNTRLRPQSGTAGMTAPSGVNAADWARGGPNGVTPAALNHWTAIGTMPNYTTGAANGYSDTLGTDNFNTGGLTIRIQAQAVSGTGTSAITSAAVQEVAYRSVLVFNNSSQSNSNQIDISTLIATINNAKLWVRGGNLTSGDPTIPDFPISRNKSKYLKAKLMTPITPPNTFNANASYNNSNIPANYNVNGQYLWFWVTWNVNVIAYVDFFVGDFNYNTATHEVPYSTSTKEFYKAWVPHKEHYCLHPGRTTVVETTNGYRWQSGGQHGNLDCTSTSTVPSRTD